MLAVELDNSHSIMSPVLKPRKRTSIDDDLSTAAPSPNFGPQASPWASPVRNRSVAGSLCSTHHLTLEFLEEEPHDRSFGKVPPDFELEEAHFSRFPQTLDNIWENGAIANFFNVRLPSNRAEEDEDMVPPLIAEDCTPPATPRQANMTPPATPRRAPYSPFGDEPPSAPKVAGLPLLMKALMKNSEVLLREAILADPDVARFPFWDHQMEPPLCFAVRRKCSVEIVRLLLQHGAEVHAKDSRGNSPADLLQVMRNSGFGYRCDIEEIEQLLNVRPTPVASQGTKTTNDKFHDNMFLGADSTADFDTMMSQWLDSSVRSQWAAPGYPWLAPPSAL